MATTARTFGTEIVKKATQWFFARLTEHPGETTIWVSFVQLYVDFQLAWGHPGPLKVQSRWVDVDQRPYLATEIYAFKLRVRWFRQLLKSVWKEARVQVALEQLCRPASDVIHAFLPSASLPWDSRAVAETDHWLGTHLQSPCVRNAAALQALPLAAQSGSMVVCT